MPGRSVDDYGAPLFVAWQLSNRCQSRCIACCEESGPDKAWADELGRDDALELARRIGAAGIPYVAFGGGEPLGVPFCWELFEAFAAHGVALKLETDGSRIDDAAAARLASLPFECIQVSVDGANAETHVSVRPGSSFSAATDAIRRLVARGLRPQLAFVPTRLNIHEIEAAYGLALALGCGAFVTGPLMRIGRAAESWSDIACSDEAWALAVTRLRERSGADDAMDLAIYPWDIFTEMERRLENPQAMLLVVPNGKVKLLNALPFAPADLRRQSLSEAWEAYKLAWRAPEVRSFVGRCRAEPALLRHANETWPVTAGPAFSSGKPLRRSS
jgi:MoaA/NifB/PqqE/SkfB family radical SAM enzyme